VREVGEFLSNDLRVWTEGEDVLIADLCVCKEGIKSGGDERNRFLLLERDLVPFKPVAEEDQDRTPFKRRKERKEAKKKRMTLKSLCQRS